MIQAEKATNSSIVLVVDDDRTTLMAIETRLQKQGYKIVTATNGKEACDTIKKMHNILDAILLDRIMPGMDGLEVLKWLKKQPNLTKPPIIMVTGANKPDQIKEGIDAGVFYYLTKPLQADVLKSIILSAVRESRQHRTLDVELKRHKASFKLMERGIFQLSTLEEAENISCFIANCFPDAKNVLPGIAELIINAVEHGNLLVSYDEKSKFIESGTWQEELNRRSKLPENKDKKVEIIFIREGDKYSIKISDQGKGFNWSKFMNVDPARALDNHGRGIARANMIFSKLQYNKEGNQVIAVIDQSEHKNLEW